jgi:phage terminase large subunit GpA-like protein
MSQWVEEEIVLPNGPFADERYRHHRHPVSRLWFGAVDSAKWSRHAATGPTQNGKTLMCYAAPVLYHLFELRETVILGLPSMDMANDKWTQDFLPVVQASNYRDLLPLKGEGSKGGQVKRSITFRNGAMLRFMSGGGSDKKRAGFTSRVVAITETDGMDEPGETSREADKIAQIEGRTMAYGRTGKRIYLECTTSIERGRIWQELLSGTNTRIARPCPHCGEHVTPEREHLVGWQAADSEEAAGRLAFWSCPECGEAWSEAERVAAAAKAVLVHHGQSVVDGSIVGPEPETQTFSLRWSAIDNPFVTAADLGAEEWRARRAKDRENAEKEMRQFRYTLPAIPLDVDLTPLDPDDIRQRTSDLRRGIAPNETLGAVVQVDTGKRKLHYEVKAVLPDESLRVIEYGVQTVESDRLGVHRGIVEALGRLRLYLENGWHTVDGRRLLFSQMWIDAGYHEHRPAVYTFCEEANAGGDPGRERFRPTKGYGEGQRNTTRYRAPDKRDGDMVYVGREFHITRVRENGKLVSGVQLVHVNSDFWKSENHQRLLMPAGQPGAITLFASPDPYEHADYSAHQVAERQREKFLPNVGTVTVWDRISRQNHHLDTAYGSTCCAFFLLDLHRQQLAAAQEGSQSWADQLAAVKRGQR